MAKLIRMRCNTTVARVCVKSPEVAAHFHSSESASAHVIVHGIAVEILLGDIVSVNVEAIVNASNVNLVLGGGVSHAIRRASRNPGALQATMSALAPLAPGGLVETSSYGIPTAPRILHVATASDRESVVASSLEAILRRCAQSKRESLALPALGTGTGGLPMRRFAHLLREALEKHAQPPWPKLLVVVLNEISAFENVREVLSAELLP